MNASGGDQSALGAPFSQAQILHLMRSEFGRARRHGYPLSCMLVRADRLDRLTDRFGHPFREELRHRLGQLIADKTRDHDHVGLVGDDSFLLVLPHTDAPAAQRVAERIRRALAEHVQLEVEGAPVSVTASVGVSSCADKETLFFETLVSQAELALERAQHAGGDRAETFRKSLFVAEPFDRPADLDLRRG